MQVTTVNNQSHIVAILHAFTLYGFVFTLLSSSILSVLWFYKNRNNVTKTRVRFDEMIKFSPNSAESAKFFCVWLQTHTPQTNVTKNDFERKKPNNNNALRIQQKKCTFTLRRPSSEWWKVVTPPKKNGLFRTKVYHNKINVSPNELDYFEQSQRLQ